MTANGIQRDIGSDKEIYEARKAQAMKR